MCPFLQIEPKYTPPPSVKRKNKEKLYNNTVVMILVLSQLSNTLNCKDLEGTMHFSLEASSRNKQKACGMIRKQIILQSIFNSQKNPFESELGHNRKY